MKQTPYKSNSGKMKFSRLVVYLFLVAVIGFLNVFMTDNFGPTGQAGDKNKPKDVYRNELIKLDLTMHEDLQEVRL
jgi:hypothetical protein